MNGLQHSPLTDGYALGITVLMALVAQPAVGLKRACRLLLKYPEQPARWQAPAVPDATAGEWPEHVVATLATMVASLTLEDEVERVRKAGKTAQVDPNVLMEVQMRISEAVAARFGVTDDQVMTAVEAFGARNDPSFKDILQRIATTLSSSLG